MACDGRNDHSGVAKDILLCNLTVFGFRNPDLNNSASTAPIKSFKANNKDSFRRDKVRTSQQ